MIRQNFPCFPFFPGKKWGVFGPPGPPTDEGPVFIYDIKTFFREMYQVLRL